MGDPKLKGELASERRAGQLDQSHFQCEDSQRLVWSSPPSCFHKLFDYGFVPDTGSQVYNERAVTPWLIYGRKMNQNAQLPSV